MARYRYVVLLCAIAGREDEFDRWYDTQHLADVKRMPGVVGAERFRVDWQRSGDFEAPSWRSLAIYELETDDPQTTLAAIRAASGTEAMPLSDAMTKTGMLTLIASPVPPRD